ncbi:MAG: hypothetical protein D6677_04960 [Calditrichaeota bacterium]|nr:MAG: hypothetical protein D6677_04960 [Calditrichota bacterium]
MAVDAFKLLVVVTVYMAVAACIPFVFMLPGIDGEILAVVIERSAFPIIRVMAVIAGGWETGGRVIGIGCAVIIGLVAGHAFRGCIAVTVAMARGAILLLMGAGEREVGIVMIKISRRPLCGVMTGGAIVTEIVAYMVGVLHTIKITAMATPAIGGRVGVAVAVAVDTVDGSMGAGKREIGVGVIEVSRRPLCGVMTGGAIMTEIVGGMVRIVRIVKVAAMATPAIGRRVAVTVAVAVDAVDGSMGAGKREIGVGVIEVSRRPLCGVMTGGAIMTEVVGGMVRIIGVVKVGVVTAKTISRQAVQFIVYMTIDALNGTVRAG